MYLKSFFAATVEAALAEGRRELGPEALIVQSRKAPPESRHLGPWEIVLASTAGAPPRAPAAAPAAGDEPVARELAELRRQMESMRRALSRASVAAPTWLAPSPQTAAIFGELVEAEVETGLSQHIAERVASHLGPATVDVTLVRRAAAAEIENRVAADATLGREGAASRLVALVGPPGSGKTTTLVKLAVLYGLSARRPVVLVSADTVRIAAADQLRTYAAILGVAFEMAETPAALGQALQLHGAKELILIDTPGLAAAEMEQGAELAAYLASRPEIDTHLVLSASMKSADITRAVDRYEIFRPAKLLFTKLDETESRGPVLNETVRTGKPVSFLAAGQVIPEHLEPATKSRVAELLLPAGVYQSLAAA